MLKSPALTKLEQGKILRYSSVNMSIRNIAKAVGRSKSVVHAFLENPEEYGTKKSPEQSRLLKTHGRTRLRRYVATGQQVSVHDHPSPQDGARDESWTSDTLAQGLKPSGVLEREKVQYGWPGWLQVLLARFEKRQKDYMETPFRWWIRYGGNQDTFDYQQPLPTHLFEFVDGVHEGSYVFQHDNASIYRARATKDFLADLNIPTID